MVIRLEIYTFYHSLHTYFQEDVFRTMADNLDMFCVPSCIVRTRFCQVSRDSVVGIATSYGLDDRGVGIRVPVGSRIFSSPDRPDRL
jgi:hypothetical protein